MHVYFMHLHELYYAFLPFDGWGWVGRLELKSVRFVLCFLKSFWLIGKNDLIFILFVRGGVGHLEKNTYWGFIKKENTGAVVCWPHIFFWHYFKVGKSLWGKYTFLIAHGLGIYFFSLGQINANTKNQFWP